MAYTHISTLTTTNSNTYANSSEWIAEHGACGLNHDLVVSGSIAADGTGSVTRTLTYPDEASRNAHKAAVAGVSKTWTASLVSAG